MPPKAYLFLLLFLYSSTLFNLLNCQLFSDFVDNDERFGFRARMARFYRIKVRQIDRRKTLKKALGHKNYVKIYGKHLGVFPGAFGLLQSGHGALGLAGLGAGGLNAAMGPTGLGGVKLALNVAGKRAGIADKLGTDLMGRYGILSPAGLDDLANGVFGDMLFNPGAILELDRNGKQMAVLLGLASGPAIAASTLANTVGSNPIEALAMMSGASLAGLGVLGPAGVAAGAAAGGLAAATAGAGTLGTGLGAGVGAGLSAIPVLGGGALSAVG